MLERSTKQRFIINTFMITSVLAIIILVGLLIWRAGRLGVIEAAVSERFALGPVGLFELGKVPLDGGYQATIGFLPGVAVYFALWVLLAVAYIWLKLSAGGQTSRKRSTPL